MAFVADSAAGTIKVYQDGAALLDGANDYLDLAAAGFKVYLVEKEASIGGIMAALDKTYPTMDCSI